MIYADYYKTLGVDKTATKKEIRSAFRKSAKECHPDTHPNDKVAEAKFKELNEAYEVLGDPDKRARYDQLGPNWNQYQNMGGQGHPGQGHKVEFGSQMFDLNFSDFFETFFGDQSGGFWDKQQQNTHDDPMSSFRQQGRGSLPPQDTTYNTDINLKEALNGALRRVRLKDGKTLEVKIPPGVREGSKIRVGDPRQNIFLLIHLQAHPRFKVDDIHLKTQLELQDYEAMLGISKTIPTLSGSIQMKIPAGSQAGQTFRIKGHGLPKLKSPKERGDLYVNLQVKIAKDLSEEEKDLIEKFKALRQGSGH